MKDKKSLTAEQIKSIPELLKENGNDVQKVAKVLKRNPQTIHFWIRELRKKGYEIKLTRGRKSIIHQL